MIVSKLARQFLVALAGTLPIISFSALAQGTLDMQAPTSLSETYESWTVQCANQQQGDKIVRICQMSQELFQQESRQRVLTFVAQLTESGTTKATLMLPFGLLLADGVRINIADDELLRTSYRTCFPTGCVAETELPREVVERLKTAETASVLMTANSGQPVKTDISLKGFASAYQRLANLVSTE